MDPVGIGLQPEPAQVQTVCDVHGFGAQVHHSCEDDALFYLRLGYYHVLQPLLSQGACQAEVVPGVGPRHGPVQVPCVVPLW